MAKLETRKMEALGLLGTILGVGFASGLNLYATVLIVGVAIRLGWAPLPESVSSLEILADPWVMGVAAAAFAIEFIADKIPLVDSFWDLVHTVVRPVGAAVIAWKLCGKVDPALETALVVLCGGVAFTSHTTKAAVRAAANTSPEPVSNVVLSVIEDFVAFVAMIVTVVFPVIALFLVAVFIVAFIMLLPMVIRFARRKWARVQRLFRRDTAIDPQ